MVLNYGCGESENLYIVANVKNVADVVANVECQNT